MLNHKIFMHAYVHFYTDKHVTSHPSIYAHASMLTISLDVLPHKYRGSVCSLSATLKAPKPALRFTLQCPLKPANAPCGDARRTHTHTLVCSDSTGGSGLQNNGQNTLSRHDAAAAVSMQLCGLHTWRLQPLKSHKYVCWTRR